MLYHLQKLRHQHIEKIIRVLSANYNVLDFFSEKHCYATSRGVSETDKFILELGDMTDVIDVFLLLIKIARRTQRRVGKWLRAQDLFEQCGCYCSQAWRVVTIRLNNAQPKVSLITRMLAALPRHCILLLA